ASPPARATTAPTVSPSPARTTQRMALMGRASCHARAPPASGPGFFERLEVERHAAGDEPTAGGVRRAPVGPHELGLRAREVVGAAADEAADVGVDGQRPIEPDLETAAELPAEVAVVRVDRGRRDVRPRPAEAAEEIELRPRLRVEEEERVERP